MSVNAVSDKIDNPNFLDTGHGVHRYFQLLIITERGIGHFDYKERLGGSRMACNNVSIVKNQIRLWLILIVDSERVLDAYAIPGFPLIRQNLGKRIDNRPMIFSNRSHNHDLPFQKLDGVIFGQNSHFTELIKLRNFKFPGFRLNRHTKKDSQKSYKPFGRSATEFYAKANAFLIANLLWRRR
jgi:hypothetical protein